MQRLRLLFIIMRRKRRNLISKAILKWRFAVISLSSEEIIRRTKQDSKLEALALEHSLRHSVRRKC